MMVDMSTPMTCLAPAFTANLWPNGKTLAAGRRDGRGDFWSFLTKDGLMGCKHAEDGCTASDVQDDLVLENVSILIDGVAV